MEWERKRYWREFNVNFHYLASDSFLRQQWSFRSYVLDFKLIRNLIAQHTFTLLRSFHTSYYWLIKQNQCFVWCSVRGWYWKSQQLELVSMQFIEKRLCHLQSSLWRQLPIFSFGIGVYEFYFVPGQDESDNFIL